MAKGLLRGLTLAAFAALGTMTFAASAGAVTPINSCRTLSTIGETYVLTGDLPLLLDPPTCGTCLVVANDRITIDLAGHTIDGGLVRQEDGTWSCSRGAEVPAGLTAGITENGMPRQGTTVKNGKITGFGVGVDLFLSTRNLIRNLTPVSANSGDGIAVGDHSLVKSSVIKGNGKHGIHFSGDFGQVQDCTVGGPAAREGNVGTGIYGGDHLLITNNIVVGNMSGIVVGESSTVSFNTSNGNTINGVSAANRSLVTGNTTIGNGTAAAIASIAVGDVVGQGGIDIDVFCPSTVTNNQASGNMTNYNFNGPPSRCQTNNNK